MPNERKEALEILEKERPEPFFKRDSYHIMRTASSSGASPALSKGRNGLYSQRGKGNRRRNGNCIGLRRSS